MRRLTLCIGLVASVTLVSQAPLAAQSTAGIGSQAVDPESGNRLVLETLDRFGRYASITARVRHQCRLDDDTLVGSGTYWQQGKGDQSVSRFEMQTQLVGKTASFVQVFDGEYLWTDRRFPSGREVRRLEVARLQARLPSRGQGPYANRLAAASVRGGISQMLADLQHRFRFDPPRATQLNGLPVLALVGRWRERGLKELWPEFDALAVESGEQEWPVQLPHHALLLVGQNNYFPYVIEQRRFSDAFLANTVTGLRPTTDPLLRYEIFEVQTAIAIEQQLFEYKPGDVDWTDETTAVLERMTRPTLEPVGG